MIYTSYINLRTLSYGNYGIFLSFRTRSYGNYGIFLAMSNAGFVSSAGTRVLWILLGGSWAVISGVISRVTIVITP